MPNNSKKNKSWHGPDNVGRVLPAPQASLGPAKPHWPVRPFLWIIDAYWMSKKLYFVVQNWEMLALCTYREGSFEFETPPWRVPCPERRRRRSPPPGPPEP
jgi:hypothetical protein